MVSLKSTEQLKAMLEQSVKRRDKIAMGVSGFFGSMWFLSVTVIFITLYLLWNWKLIPGAKPFDNPTLDNLDTALSILAIIMTISVLIGQNRQNKIAKIREQLEFEINVRAENEITKMLGMLHAIHQKLGIDKPDEQLEIMKKELDIEKLHNDIQKQQEEI